MAEEIIEEEVMEVPEQETPVQEPPSITPEQKAKVAEVVRKMKQNGESDTKIRAFVLEAKKKYSSPATSAVKKNPLKQTPTTSPEEEKAFDQRAQPWQPTAKKFASGPMPKEEKGQPKKLDVPAYTGGELPSNAPNKSVEVAAEFAPAKRVYGVDNINQAKADQTKMIETDGVKGSLEVLKSLRNQSIRNLRDQSMSTMGGLDGVAAWRTQQMGIALEKSIADGLPKPTEEQARMLLVEAKNNPELGRKILNQTIKSLKTPEEKNAAMERQYLVDYGEDVPAQGKILQNAEALRKGEIVYNVEKGQLEKPVGFFQGVVDGLKERKKELDTFDSLAEASDAEAAKKMDLMIAESNDPHRVIPVAEGLTGIGGTMVGSYLPEMGITGAATAAAVGTGGASLAISSLIGGTAAFPSFAKREYARKRVEIYQRLLEEGMPKLEAARRSDLLATQEGLIDAGINVATSAVGLGGGLKSAGKLSEGFLNTTFKALKEQGKNIVPLAGGAAAGEMGKNLLEQEAGLDSDLLKNVPDVIAGTAGMVAGFHVVGNALRGIGKLAKRDSKTIINGLASQSDEKIKEALATALDMGAIKEEDVPGLVKLLEEEKILDAKVPSTIKGEARIDAQDIVSKIERLETEKESVPKSLHDEIDAKIEAQKMRLQELKNSKPEVKEEVVAEVKPAETKIEVKEFTKHEEAALAIDEVFAAEDVNLAKASNEKFANKELSVGDEKLKVDDYVRKATVVSNALYPEMEVLAHSSDADFRKASEIDDPAYGVHNQKDNKIHLNLERMANDGKGNTAFHEAIHPILNEIASSYKGMITGMSDMIKQHADKQGVGDAIAHSNLYETKAKQELELVTEYISLVADGKIDTATVPKELMAKVIDFVNKGLEKLGIDYRISNANDLRSLSEAIKKSFDTEDASHIEKLLGKRNKEGAMKSAESNLSLKGDSPRKYEKLKEVIAKAKNSTDEELVTSLKKHLPEDEARSIVNEVRGEKRKSVSVTRPEERANVEATTISPKQPDSSQSKTTQNEGQRKGQEEGMLNEKGAEETTAPNPTNITHAETARVREELGLKEYEKTVKKDAELEAEVDTVLQKDPDATNKLLDDLESGKKEGTTDVEQKLLDRRANEIVAALEKDPFNKQLLNDYDRLTTLSDKSRTIVGRALRAVQGERMPLDSWGDTVKDARQSKGGRELTEKEMTDLKKEYDDIKKSRDEEQAKVAKLQEEFDKKEAENLLLREKLRVQAEAKKTKSSTKGARDFEKEKKDVLAEMKAAIQKSKGSLYSVPLPYAPQLIAAAPHVAKYVKILVEQGIDKIDDIVASVKDVFKDDIPDLQDRDVIDLIRGEYNPKGKTRNQLAEKVQDLKTEARLMSKLDDLLNNKKTPATEKALQKQNAEIEKLRKQIKELGGNVPDDKTKLKSLISSTQKRIKELDEKIKAGDFEKEQRVPILENEQAQKEFPELFEEAQKARAEYQKKRRDYEVARLKEEYKNRDGFSETKEFWKQALNISREFQSTGDVSGVLRQGLVLGMGYPKLAVKAFREMTKSTFNQERFEKWFNDLEGTKAKELMEASGLSIADPSDPRLLAKEDAFMGGGLGGRLPVIGSIIRGSERAYTIYLNKLRADAFMQEVAALEAQGKTFKNSPELYKGWARYINAASGRGDLGKLNANAGVLSLALYSPRLIASRMQLLGLSDVFAGATGDSLGKGFYASLPKEVRAKAMGDMLKTVAAGYLTLALAKSLGAEVEFDPRSSDFGKIKVGETRYDIWAGLQPYVRLVSQLASASIKKTSGKVVSTTKNKMTDKDADDIMYSFWRSKLSPSAGLATDLAFRKTSMGDDINFDFEEPGKRQKNLPQLFRNYYLPLMHEDLLDVIKDPSAKQSADLIVNMLGVGVQEYDRDKK